MVIHYRYMESPIGRLLVAGDEEGLRYIGFPSGKSPLQPGSAWKEDPKALDEAIRQLHAYFGGELKAFSLTLAPRGTPFQLSVLRALQGIPYGQTISYGELARRIGRPRASRAVGAANARNPLPIVIPCHRVIGSDGSLTGFGGGLEVKKALLALERRYR
jgi:methylated-DNA-[protein]-cysteine S-methyltransferase